MTPIPRAPRALLQQRADVSLYLATVVLLAGVMSALMT